MTVQVLEPPHPIPERARAFLHKYLDEMLDHLQWDDGPWMESRVGWTTPGSSGDIRLKVGRADW